MAARSAQARTRALRVGFVPTMGALHEGHLELVRTAGRHCDLVVASIFVNPLQFNDPKDLERYPRQPERDRELLEQAGCHVLFSPQQDPLFAGFTPKVHDLGGLADHWEGPSRPGHFQGVVNVVERLFFYVRPDEAFFGEKDRQQLTIIRHMAQRLRWPERITGCPTVRAADGLALSSRNQRLSPAERIQATVLYRALQAAAAVAFTATVEETRKAALTALASEPAVRMDHFGIAASSTLAPLEAWDGVEEAVALIAAQVGPVRLIDNITLRRPEGARQAVHR